MATLKITNFGGEVPRLPPRILPPDAAQLNKNLLTTANEFRPLHADTNVAAAPIGAKTLYRLGRNADGSMRTDDTSGWIAETQDKNYVKGQLNDDATERTVVTWNDGTQRPRVIDAKGSDRLLGVPAPVSVGVSLNAVTQFTMEDALNWVSGELVPTIATALRESLYEHDYGSRFSGNVPVAGATQAHGMEHYQPVPWNSVFRMNREVADRYNLTGGDVGRVDLMGNEAGFTIETGPYWGRVTSIEGLRARLRLIESPKDGTQVFTDPQIVELSDALASLFDPAGSSLKAKRAEMDKLAEQFVKALGTAIATSPTPRPTEPARPSAPLYDYSAVGTGELAGAPRHPQWVAYDNAMLQYREDVAAWERSEGDFRNAAITAVAEINRIRKASENLSNEIEAEYFRRKERIETLVSDLIAGKNVVGGEGSMIQVDPDRIVDTRFYVATYVTDWGEESAPSPVSEMLEVDQNDTVTVTVPPPPDGRNITHWRLYRSNTGTTESVFQFVDDSLISTLTYEDSLKGELLGEPCPSFMWAEPPFRIDSGSAAEQKPPKGDDPYLKGAVGMPNGIIAAYVDNFVAFCHPYHPYAWPVEYQITTEHPITGLGVFGQTLFVGTMANPYLISGADSASMSSLKLPQQQACVSARSIVGVGSGVVYASPDGLCMASPQGVELLTGALFSREDWQALAPENIVAAEHEGVYYFTTAAGCLALDFIGRKLGRVDMVFTAAHKDALTDHLFAVQGDRVLKLFSTARRTATWRSSLGTMPAQAPLAWLQVDGDQSESAPVVVRWYADGVLRHTASVTDIQPKRLPAGRWLEHEVEVESSARLTKLMLASTTGELKGA